MAFQRLPTRGCLAALALFFLGWVGTCMPIGFVIGMPIINALNNRQNEWYRQHARTADATIIEVAEFHNHSGKHYYVTTYQVEEHGQLKQYKEEHRVGFSDKPHVGDRFSVWIIDGKARKVEADVSPWPPPYVVLVGPLACLPLLFIILWRSWKQNAANRECGNTAHGVGPQPPNALQH